MLLSSVVFCGENPFGYVGLCRNVLRDTVCPWKHRSGRWDRPQGAVSAGAAGCVRRGAAAVVTKTGKCIFPCKKEAVYRLSKKRILPSVQRWFMALWEDFAACVWNSVTSSVPASAVLCLQSPPFEPLFAQSWWECFGRVPACQVQSYWPSPKQVILHFAAELCKCFCCWSMKNGFILAVLCLRHLCDKTIQKTVTQTPTN